MKLTAIRHGETNINVNKTVDAKLGKHVFLTEKGEKQIEETALKLKDEKFDLIIVSELYRAQQSAGIINQYHQQMMIVDPRINENDFDVNGMTYKEAHKIYDGREDWFTYKHGNGESFQNVKERVWNFLDELKKKKHLKNVLVVTHEIVLKMIKAYVEGLTDNEIWHLHFKNAEIITVEI